MIVQLGGIAVPPAMLRRALTHRSFSADHNERLEFLGDAVLNLCVSSWLMQRLPDASEGELSRTRANLVNETALHALALKLGLPELLLLGEGERKTGGQQRASILADALEAIIGAVYLDGGFTAAQAVVELLLAGVDLSSTARAKAKDAKTSLQEWLQARRLSLPRYQLQEVHGAEHRQVFVVVCEVPELGKKAAGEGASRKAAEQQAAAQVLQSLTIKE